MINADGRPARCAFTDDCFSSNGRGGIHVSVKVEPTPPPDWEAFFRQPVTTQFQLHMSAPRFQISNGVVEFDVGNEEDLERVLPWLDERIGGTNDWHFLEHVPGLVNRKVSEDVHVAEQEKKLAELRARMKGR